MISLIRKYPRVFNVSPGLFVAVSQVMRHAKPRYTSTSKNIPISEIVRKPTNLLTDGIRKLSSSENKYQDFHAVFPDILSDLKEIISGYKQKGTSEWLTRVLEYNLRNSEKNIFLLTVLTYEQIVEKENSKTENMRLSHILGWCTEMLNTAILMFDDIIDNGSSRRGQPCWHTLDNVGLTGINDAFLVENVVYVVLKKNFRHLDCYPALMELFHEASFITACGQSLDIQCASKSVKAFNMETFNIMAVNKATYDNFYLPFAVAMQLAGFTDEAAIRQSKAIILEIGLFFQIQNDFLDCFGTLDSAGKVGTDIQDNKYSWLAVACMERASDEQKQIMVECYGKNDFEKIQRVKELYKALDLPAVYAAYEEESYKNTEALIKQTSNGVPHEIFLQILNRIYRRDSLE